MVGKVEYWLLVEVLLLVVIVVAAGTGELQLVAMATSSPPAAYKKDYRNMVQKLYHYSNINFTLITFYPTLENAFRIQSTAHGKKSLRTIVMQCYVIIKCFKVV